MEVAEVFKPETRELTLTEVDNAVTELAKLRADYEAKKKIQKEAKDKYDEQVALVLQMMEESGKKGFKVDGIASVTKKTSMSVRVPNNHEDKAKLFKWLSANLGAEGYLTYATVNSQSLNALYNSMWETAEDKQAFSIDGVGEPVERVTLSFRKI